MRTRQIALVFIALTAGATALPRIARLPADRASPRYFAFDVPDAALHYATARRAPLDSGLSLAALYESAAWQRDRLPRFSSRIRRVLPAALPPARLSRSGA